MKLHSELFHLGITLTEKSSELISPALFGKGRREQSVNSLNLRDSIFSAKAFTSLTQLLGKPKTAAELHHITGNEV